MLRADSHYCTPEVLRYCRAQRLGYTLGVAPTTTLRKHIITLEQSTASRAGAADGKKLRRFKEFHDGAASWDRVERIVARVDTSRGKFACTCHRPCRIRRSSRWH
jgi:hypothetical protein